MTRRRPTPNHLFRLLGSGLAILTFTACSSPIADSLSTTDTATTDTANTDTAISDTSITVGASETAMVAPTGDLGAVGTLASDEVHEIDVTFDDDEYVQMLSTYATTGEKEWIVATVTIDGETYEEVGLRLKGNSSLRGVSVDAAPETLPWLIRLDKFVDDQNHDGLTDLVVRSNVTATSLNEAVALELLQLAGLAAQDAIATSFSVNGSDSVLRLTIDNPDDVWMAETLGADGALYKAESTGDFTYRGDDPDSYDEVFDQEAGKDNADLTPLIEFLDFINNSDDQTFAAELDEWLDVDAFATYLAMQELIDNFDDIDGPGNNSYLYYDTDTERFTVVPWDHNLAFGETNGDAGGPAGQVDGAPGGDFERPAPGGGAQQGPGGAQGGPNGSNVLSERFLAVDAWQTLVTERLADLDATLVESGQAADVLAEWQAIVADSGLVDAATVASEAAEIAAQLS